jgi:cytochrome P450
MCLLTFTIYCLSEHPHILTTLREEIMSKIGPTRRPTFDDVKDLKYLRAVLNGLSFVVIFVRVS